MKTLNAILGAALLAGSSMAHVAIKPPSPDRWLTPNSSTAPPGCKLLASDKGFPTEQEVMSAFPKAFRKMQGTEGPDFWLQPGTVEEVQKAVNFAREKNIRLNIISTGHDFHGREDQRSGLRVDMAALIEPTVFSNEWKCGDTLKPTVNGRVVGETFACKVPSQKRNVGRGIPGRNWDHIHFEKRDGASQDCSTLVKRHVKRHGPDAEEATVAGQKGAKTPTTGAKVAPPPAADVKYDPSKPWEWGQKTGFQMPPSAQVVDSFNKIKPTGKHAYARIPGGMYNEKLFAQAHESGLMSLGAQHGGVSTLGGWMQAGGHNPFVNVHGMMVDNVVELEVVTPDGKFQKVSDCNNPELFWALRGGGGSTFGIVTGGTVKVYPTFPVVVSRFFVNVTQHYDPGLMKAVAHFLQRGATLRDKYGLQGYFYVYPNGFHSVLHMPDKYADMENAKKATQEIQGEMEKIAGAKHIEPDYFSHKSYKEWYIAEMGDEEMEETGQKFLSWYDGAYGDAPSAEEIMMNPLLVLPFRIAEQQREAKEAAGKAAAAAAKASQAKATKMKRDAAAAHSVARTQPQGRTYLDSRLLSNKQVNSVSLDDLAKVINETFPRIVSNNFRGFLYGGGAQASPDKDALGLLPAWRDATFHFIINALPGGTRHDYNIRAFDKLFPDAGAYVNEASPEEPDWKNKFWGSHYSKLEGIKKKVDPNNVLWCSPCVGADMLTYDDERLCKNGKYPVNGPAPQTYSDATSKFGIASLPGREGIANPLLPIIQAFMVNKTIPATMPASSYFKMAMGQGGSSGGRWSLGPPANAAAPVADHGHAGMGANDANPAKQVPTSPVETPVVAAGPSPTEPVTVASAAEVQTALPKVTTSAPGPIVGTAGPVGPGASPSPKNGKTSGGKSSAAKSNKGKAYGKPVGKNGLVDLGLDEQVALAIERNVVPAALI